MNSLNPQTLSLPKSEHVSEPKPDLSEDLPTRIEGDKFLRGPIPWSWVCRASKLSGRSLNVAIGIWLIAGIKKKRAIKLSQKVMRGLGLNRNAVYRGLGKLEKEGLVSVERHSGRNSIITILEI